MDVLPCPYILENIIYYPNSRMPVPFTGISTNALASVSLFFLVRFSSLMGRSKPDLSRFFLFRLSSLISSLNVELSDIADCLTGFKLQIVTAGKVSWRRVTKATLTAVSCEK